MNANIMEGIEEEIEECLVANSLIRMYATMLC